MEHPAFAFFVVIVSSILYKRQLGIKVAIKFWWTPMPNHKVAFSWKTTKKADKKKLMAEKGKSKQKEKV